jgi:hypothetical protein
MAYVHVMEKSKDSTRRQIKLLFFLSFMYNVTIYRLGLDKHDWTRIYESIIGDCEKSQTMADDVKRLSLSQQHWNRSIMAEEDPQLRCLIG